MKNKITLKTILTNLDAIITGLTLSICVVLVNANVIMRYFFNSPIHWAEEVVTSLFVWTVFIGSAYAYRKHSHLGVDILVNILPDKIRKVVKSIEPAILSKVILSHFHTSIYYTHNYGKVNKNSNYFSAFPTKKLCVCGLSETNCWDKRSVQIPKG